MSGGYDSARWVDADIAARRHRWVRYAALVPFVAMPAFAAIALGGWSERFAWLDTVSTLLPTIGLIAWITTLFSPFGPRPPRPSWQPAQPSLDERERQIVAAAHGASYWVAAGLLVAAFVYGGFAAVRGWWMPRGGEDYGALALSSAVMLLALPVAIAEWRAPYPPPEDEES